MGEAGGGSLSHTFSNPLWGQFSPAMADAVPVLVERERPTVVREAVAKGEGTGVEEIEWVEVAEGGGERRRVQSERQRDREGGRGKIERWKRRENRDRL